MKSDLIHHARVDRVVFYDELGHMNPVYSAPDVNQPWSLRAEVQYHARNLRLLSLYFDTISIMTGNILNYPNYTTKAVVWEVLKTRWFQGLCEQGIVTFCGWGSLQAEGMVGNQIDYSCSFRPDLKDKLTLRKFRQTTTSSRMFIREYTTGEEDFFVTLLERVRLQAERQPHPDWAAVKAAVLDTQREVNHIGTMHFFPRLTSLAPEVRRQSHRIFLDSWTDYAARRYYPVKTYESPRYSLNPYRTIGTPSEGKGEIASILLSPGFFERFLLRFFDDEEYYRLLHISPLRLSFLRNGDWAIFCDQYHRYLKAASNVLWKLNALSNGDTGPNLVTAEDTIAAFEEVLDGSIRDLHGAFDALAFADFLAYTIKVIWPASPKKFVSIVLRPVAEIIERASRNVFRGLATKRMHHLYPFLAKIRSAVT